MSGAIDEGLHRALVAARERSAAFADAWRRSDAITALTRRFAGDESGEAAARALLSQMDWLGGLLDVPLAELTADPLFEAPYRCSRDSARTGAVLYDGPRASISATVVRACANDGAVQSGCVVAAGRLSFTRYFGAEEAVIERWFVGRPNDPFIAGEAQAARTLPSLTLLEGQIVRHDGREEGHRLSGLARNAVMVTVALRDQTVPLVREYAGDDGRLIRAASLDDRPARAAMLLRLLREQGRTDAPEVFEMASRDDAFFLRWEAMREWLALDAMAALPRLTEMAARDPHPEVRGAAATMLARINERLCDAAHRLEAMRCPA